LPWVGGLEDLEIENWNPQSCRKLILDPAQHISLVFHCFLKRAGE